MLSKILSIYIRLRSNSQYISVVGVAIAGKVKTVNKRYDSDFESQAVFEDPHSLQIADISAHHYEANKGFSVGSGLRSIAQGSADQANSAVLNQLAAAQQAAYVAQTTLAQSAIQAASTALAALAGKEVLVENLEHQVSDAHHSLEAEIAQLEISKKSAIIAKEAAAQAAKHVAVLTAALNSAQAAAEHSERAANHAEAELASQTAMVGKAKGRLDSIAQKLHAAQIDFEATKEAAGKATAAAQEAQSNAAQAGAYASAKLTESVEHSILIHPTPTVIAETIEEAAVHLKHKRAN